MRYKYLIVLLLLSVTSIKAEIPKYCKNLQEGMDQQIRVACDQLRLNKCSPTSSSSLDSLSKFSTSLVENLHQLTQRDIRKSMYRLAMSRMLEKKFALTSLYPSLNNSAAQFYAPTKLNRRRRTMVDRNKLKQFQGCFAKDPILQKSIDRAQQQYKGVQTKISTKDNRLKYITDIIHKALIANQLWQQVAPLQKEFKRKRREYQWAFNKLHMRGRYARKKEKAELKSAMLKKQQLMQQVENKIKHIRQTILQDPMWSDTTSIFEWQDEGEFKDYKQSTLLKGIISSISGMKSVKYSGAKFLSYLNSLNKQGKVTQAKSRIAALLTASPQLFNNLEKKIKRRLHNQLKDVDRGISQLCDSQGKGLAGYPAIYAEVEQQIAQQGLKNRERVTPLLKVFRKNHCALISKESESKSTWGLLAGGGLLLAGAALAPFTGGGSLAVVGTMMAGGAILTTVGGIETYNSYKRLNLEKGLIHTKLVDMQTMRQTLHDTRVNTGMTLLDVALMPMDIAGLVKVVSKGKKVAVATEQQMVKAKPAVISKKVAVTKTERPRLPGGQKTEQKLLPYKQAKQKLLPYKRTAAEIKSSPAAQAFRKRYAKADMKLHNDEFIADMKRSTPSGKKALYFDVENSVLKKMNDVIFDDKELGDAAGNLFANKVYELVKKDPLLSKKLKFDYKDYKSLRLKFLLDKGEDAAIYEQRLAQIYKQANKNFVKELEKSELYPLWKGKIGQLGHPEQWFLAGVGDNALEANMATRTARELVETHPNGVMASFKQQEKAIEQHYSQILEYRDRLATSSNLTDHGIMHKGTSGQMILDDSAIEIVRKSSASDGEAAQLHEIQKNLEKIYGVKLSDEEVSAVKGYFDEVDAVSPPLFLEHREIIRYENAENGLVSVDFAGIGVANARHAMEGVNIAAVGKAGEKGWVTTAIKEVDKEVDKVTKSMHDAKDFYRKVVKQSYSDTKNIYFSGDDGIYMPQHALNEREKIRAIKAIAKNNPSQFRMTFVKTKYPNGKNIPGELRSNMVVTAEKLEKAIRKDIVGIGQGKIDPKKAKQMMIVVDYTPHTAEQGSFKVFVEGELSLEEKQLLKKSFEKQMDKDHHAIGIEFISR